LARCDRRYHRLSLAQSHMTGSNIRPEPPSSARTDRHQYSQRSLIPQKPFLRNFRYLNAFDGYAKR
jgi:hypothetical protein